jgi:hypothetical protein
MPDGANEYCISSARIFLKKDLDINKTYHNFDAVYTKAE